MSIVIEGMELPKNCTECKLQWDRHCPLTNTITHSTYSLTNREPDCPLKKLDENNTATKNVEDVVEEEPRLLDTWEIKGKEAELWLVKGKLQIRALGTIHNSVSVEEITKKEKADE